MLYLIILMVLFLVLRKLLASPSSKGRAGERSAVRTINKLSTKKGYGGKVLTNIYIPKETGDTSEIDILYITRKGLFVVESKNYAGFIFGSERNKNWTVTLLAGSWRHGTDHVEKYQFYNPIWQNRTHVKNLQAYLGQDIRSFSIIAFTDRGDLKDVTVTSKDVYVCYHSGLSQLLCELWDENSEIMTDEQVDVLFEKLQPLANTDETEREKHVSDIRERFDSTEVCPVCGGKLVLRTARKGANAGKQFYGCSNYPKCRYIKSLS